MPSRVYQIVIADTRLEERDADDIEQEVLGVLMAYGFEHSMYRISGGLPESTPTRERLRLRPKPRRKKGS